MENITELLEKYFRAETSITEETELKQYFKTGNISEEHKAYKPLFKVFEEESDVKPDVNPAKVLLKQRSLKRIWIQSFITMGIAATLLITLWIERPQKTETFAMVGGNRMSDTEYATKKINQVNSILNRSMKPLQNFEQVRKDMQLGQKLSNVKDRINEINNKQQIK